MLWLHSGLHIGSFGVQNPRWGHFLTYTLLFIFAFHFGFIFGEYEVGCLYIKYDMLCEKEISKKVNGFLLL